MLMILAKVNFSKFTQVKLFTLHLLHTHIDTVVEGMTF